MVLPVLEKYAEWIEAHRKSDVHGLYWNNGQGCGYDNTPRDEGRVGDPNQHSATDAQGWVDMSAQMVIQYNELATMCDELGRGEQAAGFRKLTAQIADRINQWCWNPATGLYHDVDVDGKQTSWKTIAAFWPLLAHIAAPEQQQAPIFGQKLALLQKDKGYSQEKLAERTYVLVLSVTYVLGLNRRTNPITSLHTTASR